MIGGTTKTNTQNTVDQFDFKGDRAKAKSIWSYFKDQGQTDEEFETWLKGLSKNTAYQVRLHEFGKKNGWINQDFNTWKNGLVGTQSASDITVYGENVNETPQVDSNAADNWSNTNNNIVSQIDKLKYNPILFTQSDVERGLAKSNQVGNVNVNATNDKIKELQDSAPDIFTFDEDTARDTYYAEREELLNKYTQERSGSLGITPEGEEIYDSGSGREDINKIIKQDENRIKHLENYARSFRKSSKAKDYFKQNYEKIKKLAAESGVDIDNNWRIKGGFGTGDDYGDLMIDIIKGLEEKMLDTGGGIHSAAQIDEQGIARPELIGNYSGFVSKDLEEGTVKDSSSNIENHYLTDEQIESRIQLDKEKLRAYHAGELKLSTEELAGIVGVKPEAQKYVDSFFPETIAEGEDLDAVAGAAISKAAMNDPRFSLIQTEIKSNINKESISKWKEIADGYDLDTQKGLEGAQDEFAEWYNKRFQEALSNNKEATDLFQQYGIAGEKALAERMKGRDYQPGRVNHTVLNWVNGQLDTYEDDDSIYGKVREELAYIAEAFAKVPVTTEEWTNSFEVSLAGGQQRRRNKIVNELNWGLENGKINKDMTLGEARKYVKGLDNRLNWHDWGWTDNDTVGDYLAKKEIRKEKTGARIEHDLDERKAALELLNNFITREVEDGTFDSIEGFGSSLVMGIDQITHMAPRIAGYGLMTAGTLLGATGFGAAPGAGLFMAGMGLSAIGNTIQGAMEYSSIYMEALEEKMNEEYGEGGYTTQEYMDALASGLGMHQGAALAGGTAVAVSEFAMDVLGSKIGGAGAGMLFKNPALQGIMKNTLGKFLTRAGTMYGEYKMGQVKEGVTEGFQSYLSQSAKNMAIGNQSPFTRNIDFDQILTEYKAGKKMGGLFGAAGIAGQVKGGLYSADAYVADATKIAKNIDMSPGSSTFLSGDAYFDKIKQTIENDSNLSEKEKRQAIKDVSDVRSATIKIPKTITGNTKAKLIDLLVEKQSLANKIKQVNDKDISALDIARQTAISEEIQSLVDTANQVSESLKGPTSAMGVIPTGAATDTDQVNDKQSKEIDKARAGDVAAQQKLEKYGIDWEYKPLYRFVGQSEVDALNNDETIEGKNPAFGADVTTSQDPSTGTDAEFRVTFKEEGLDQSKPGSRVRNKNDQDGWITGGYKKDDVLTIEKRNADGTYEIVYDATSEQNELNKISIDLYKDPNTSETDKNRETKNLINDNAGFFLGPKDKGGIDFVTNFEGYINKNTGRHITRKDVLNEISALLPGIIGAFNTKGKANFTTYAGASLNAKLPGIKESLIGAKEASKTKETTTQELENIAAPDTKKAKGKEFKKRKYPSDIAVIEKQTADVRPEILTNIKNSVKQFMASSVGKIKEIGGKGKKIITKLDPSSLAKELKAQNRATRAAVVAAIGKGKQYKDFVTKVINDGYIETIPIAAMKKRFKTVKGFNIEKIGRETLGAGTGIYQLSGLNKQALIDFYTKDQSGRRSFIDLLAKGLTIEQFQEVKIDTEFMNDLAFKLKEAKSELTAEEFMNEVERIYDGRSKEFASLDVIESKLDKGIAKVDKYIKDNEGVFYSGVPIAAAAQAVRGGLKILKNTYQKTKSIAKAIKAALNYLKKKFKNLTPIQIKQIWKTEVNEQSLKDNTIDIDALIDAYIEQGVKNKGIAYEKVVYDAANKVKNSIFKVIGKQTEKGKAADFMSKLAGFDFNVEIKMEKSRFGSVTMKILPNGNIKFATDYDFNPELEKAIKKNKKNIQAFRNRAEQLGQNMEDFDNGIIDKKIWEQLKEEGYLKNARTTVTLDAKEVVGGYYLAQKYPSEYMNIKGKGLVALGNNPLGLAVHTLDGTVEIEVGINTSGTIYKEVKGKEPIDTGNRSFSLRAKPFELSNVSKSNYNIDTTNGINKLLNSKEVKKLLKDKQKAAAKGPGNNIYQDSNSPTQRKDTLENSQDTQVNAQKVNKKKKGISVFDLDDTLAKTKEKVIVNMPQNLEGLTFFDKMLEKEFAKSLHTRHLRAYDWYWDPDFLKASEKYFKNRTFSGNIIANNIQRKFADLYERRKKVKELGDDYSVEELRAKLKRAKGENKENIEIALQETFKKLPTAVQDSGIDIYTGKPITSLELTPAEFAEQAQTLQEQGAEFDFSQFEDVKGAKKGPLADLALRRQDKFGSGDIYVLTARPQASAANIKLFLDSIGLNIPLKNIIGLENGSPQAKAQWVLAKTKEGYNDFYFADDSKMNVDAVKQILDQVDVKSKVQQAIADKETILDKELNEMLEESQGIKSQAKYSPVRAQLEGQKRDKGFFKWLGKQLTITPSAEDFLGLMYDLMGSGKQGNRHAKWIQDNLIDPYNKAEQTILSAKVTVANDFAALKKAFPSLRSSVKGNPLMDQIGVGPYTKSQAMRVYIWNKQGMEIPGLSKRDQNALVKAVENDMELMSFADNVILIQKDKQYPAPDENWAGGTIDGDLMFSIDKTLRRKVMTEFDENAKIIFSEKNMNKLEAIYGKKWVDALRDSLRRMQSGSNRPVYQGGGARIVNEMLDWLNGSVGAVMFLNVKSGLLQLISNVNFINWGDNNIYAAAKAFASKEYWPTVVKLMNSDYLVNRRDGLKINVNEAELANAAKDRGMKGAIAYLLDKGFIITRIMDSLAIATGGATFYINRRNALLERQNPETGKKYTQKEAEAKAFDDFYAISEESQQSSDPSKISQQQASLFGRVILAFQNVTMQYNRMTKKAIRDLYNRRKKPGMTQRESDLSNISKIIYYTTVQNIVFNALQQALFAMLFDDETDEEEKDRLANIANGMSDSLLFGLGFGGAAISTVKNVLLKVMEESDKKSPDYEEAVWEIFNVSPVLDSKVRKLRTTAKTFSWNMEEIKKRGWSLDNPTYLAVSQLISAATNIPIDRVLRKMMNMRMAMDEETRTWQRVALMLGWSSWSVGLPYWGLQSTIDQEEKAVEKAKKAYKNDLRKLKAQGYKKVMYRNLKDFDPKDIIELQSPAGTVVYYVKVGKGKQVKN